MEAYVTADSERAVFPVNAVTGNINMAFRPAF